MLQFNWGVFWAILAGSLAWHLVSRLYPITVSIAKRDLATIHQGLEAIEGRLEEIGDSVSPIAIKLATGK